LADGGERPVSFEKTGENEYRIAEKLEAMLPIILIIE
jgi:hypothetical protein